MASAWGQSWASAWGASWGPVIPPDVFSGGTARIGGRIAVDAVPRIGPSPDAAPARRIGGSTLKKPGSGRIG